MSLATIQDKLQRLEILGGPAELDAVELILAERIRQVDGEGWTPAHDDQERREGQLAAAGPATPWRCTRRPWCTPAPAAWTSSPARPTLAGRSARWPGSRPACAA